MHSSENRETGAAAVGAVLVAGLGNPGIEYQFTPHNAGFLAIDRLAQQAGVAVANRRCRALTAKVRIAGRDVVLAKPETFMNLSGIAIRALLQELNHESDHESDRESDRELNLELNGKGTPNLIVLYDDVDLPLGALRIRERGSAGGHNGVKSISGALGTGEWVRIRIGVAPLTGNAAETARRDRKDYVLTPWRKTQLAVLDEVLDRAAAAVETVLDKGVAVAMNEFNRRSPEGTAE